MSRFFAGDTHGDKPEDHGQAEIRFFNTAWAAPVPVFRRLAAMFPALR